jgi:predicted dehydrogenase
MAMNGTEARLMLAASERHPELTAQVVPSPRTLEFDATISRIIADGQLGRVLSVDISSVEDRAMIDGFIDLDSPISWRQDIEFSGLNCMSTGIWYESAARWFGHAEYVSAQTKIFVKERSGPHGEVAQIKIPDHLDALFEFGDGIQARLRVSAVTGAAPHKEDVFIYGSEATLHLNLQTRELLLIRRGQSDWSQLEIPDDERIGWRVEQEFIEAIRFGSAIKRTSFAEAVRYMEFTEAVLLSAKEHRRVKIG